MINEKYHDKIAYAARNNNLNIGLIVRLVDILSEKNNLKVVVNDNIPYGVSHKDRDINSLGKYYNWGLMQVPGFLFFKFMNGEAGLHFLAENVIELIDPVHNLEAGCKIIRYLKKSSSSMDLVIYKYISCDLESTAIPFDSELAGTVFKIVG